MSRPKVPVHIRQTSSILNEYDVLLDETAIKQLNIPTNRQLVLQFGSSKTIIKVISHAKKQINFSRPLATKLSLQQGMNLRINYSPELNQLTIGPLIAVLMSRYYGNPAQPFASNTAFCQELTEAGKQQGAFVYFLTPNQIDTNQPVLDGWCCHGKWKRMSFPYPDIIYNRLTSRRYERLNSVKQLFNHVKNRHRGYVFNERYLNKSEVFEALKKDRSLQPYLPATDVFRSYQILRNMCQKYPNVFLKPITGSLGKGIIKISRQPNGAYICHFSSAGGTKKVSYSSISKLFQAISGKMKAQRYQIQQGLTLIASQGRPIDFRALVQKGLQGEWKVTSIVARIAGSQHFVSNLARGGQLSTVKAALVRAKFPSSRRGKIALNLRKAALHIAQGIETHVKEHFGELGVDLAVDRRGKVWLLEVNSKPSKNDDTSFIQGKIRPSALKVVQYARFLTKL